MDENAPQQEVMLTEPLDERYDHSRKEVLSCDMRHSAWSSCW